MKKRIFALLQALVLLTAVTACGTSDTESAQDTKKPAAVTMAVGDPSATYYAFGNLLAGYMGGAANTEIRVVPTDGAVANVDAVNGSVYTMGMTQADTMAYAWNGTNSFADKGQMQNFRVLGGLYEEAVQIVTLDESIKTVADLRGRVVSVGTEGTGMYYNAMNILEAYGLTEEDIDMEYLGFSDAAQAMKDGDVDVAFMVSGAPTKAIEDLSAEYDVYLVSIDEETAETLIAKYPYYNKYVVQSGTYAGLNESVETISVKATMLISVNASEELVYNLTAGVYENTESISAILKRGIEISAENATTGITVPFHKGAAKYFAEKGFTVPTE